MAGKKGGRGGRGGRKFGGGRGGRDAGKMESQVKDVRFTEDDFDDEIDTCACHRPALSEDGRE